MSARRNGKRKHTTTPMPLPLLKDQIEQHTCEHNRVLRSLYKNHLSIPNNTVFMFVTQFLAA
eukprot:1023950-Amphidinium_carterae.1